MLLSRSQLRSSWFSCPYSVSPFGAWFENLVGEWLGTLEGGCGEPFSWDSVFQNLVCTASYDASVVSC